MVSLTAVTVLGLALILFVLFLYLVVSSTRKRKATTYALRDLLDEKKIAYTPEQLSKGVSQLDKASYTGAEDLTRKSVETFDEAVRYTNKQLTSSNKASSGKIFRSTGIVTLLLVLVAGLAVSLIWVQPLYYGYFIAAGACLLIGLMFNPKFTAFPFIMIVLIVLMALLIYFGAREVMIYDAASDGGSNSGAYATYDINSPDGITGGDDSIKYW